jgi:hypothetical protein
VDAFKYEVNVTSRVLGNGSCEWCLCAGTLQVESFVTSQELNAAEALRKLLAKAARREVRKEARKESARFALGV